MRSVGRRVEREMAAHASGALLAEGARFNESIAGLSRIGYVPKGIYRFRSHEEANRYDEHCLAQAMARLALARQHG